MRYFIRYLKQSRRAGVLFLSVSILPAFLMLLLTVFLSPVNLPDYGKTQKPAEPEAKKTATSELPEEARELTEKIISLEKEKAFLTARLQGTRDDSIHLSLNLVDSTINLEIRGVTVRKCRIQDFEVSSGFRHLQAQDILTSWLSTPFELKHDLATIPRAPIVVKNAPKDTLEARKLYREPRPREIDDVFLTLYFTRGLILEVEQAESPEVLSYFKKAIYRARKSFTSAGETLGAFANFEIPRHSLRIKVKLSGDDARAIYRALPVNAKLAFCF